MCSYRSIRLSAISRNIKIFESLTVQKRPDRVYRVHSQVECPVFMIVRHFNTSEKSGF